MLKWWCTNIQKDKQTNRISTCRLDPFGRRGRVKTVILKETWENIRICLSPCHTKLNFLDRASFYSTTSWDEIKTKLGIREVDLNLGRLQTEGFPQQQVWCRRSGREDSPVQPSHAVPIQWYDHWWWWPGYDHWWWWWRGYIIDQLGGFLLKGPNSTLTGTIFGLAGRLHIGL